MWGKRRWCSRFQWTGKSVDAAIHFGISPSARDEREVFIGFDWKKERESYVLGHLLCWESLLATRCWTGTHRPCSNRHEQRLLQTTLERDERRVIGWRNMHMELGQWNSTHKMNYRTMESHKCPQCSPFGSFFYKNLAKNWNRFVGPPCFGAQILTIRPRSWTPAGCSRECCRSFPPSFLVSGRGFCCGKNPRYFHFANAVYANMHHSIVFLSKSRQLSFAVDDADNVNSVAMVHSCSLNYRCHESSVIRTECRIYFAMSIISLRETGVFVHRDAGYFIQNDR